MLLRCLLITLLCVLADVSHAEESTVQPATHHTAIPVGTERTITFAQQPARVGDRVAQHVNASLDLHTTISQADQVANQSTTTMRREQQRFIEITKVADGCVRRAHVKFPLSRLTSPENENPTEHTVQPVEGKSYDVTRAGDRLLVADSAGSIPPMEEFKIVVSSLQTLGLPSPLAKFLLGRTVQVGQRLKVPTQIAAEMMGFDKQLGKVQKFEFQLQEVKLIDEQPCAVFAATIEAVGDPTNPIQMQVVGQVIIQATTCRTVSAEFRGPISMNATENTSQGNFQYSASGDMRVAIRSQYGYAAK